ncbi:MAG: bifunctional diaminohydroxyphosphoribosylaminopyrimidine deaminase/5-amino-6-(5-phosphoribosylamino)uracil reductase RibD [Thermoleophilia bacterium]|nr:bifunctional diaminohydroxyphosphoribosylaminopyrimidine deaminase/5-amino-6-(5-phosphoribosylamino)uracil reductase RibD [Thermoleophilia bacterium]
MALSRTDNSHLEWAMALAERARGLTSPNPLVGAVIVSQGRVLGEGYHVGPGCDHAEVAALRDALRRAGKSSEGWIDRWGRDARELCAGATLYVTLEPCCVWGRTPPCTDAVLAAGFARVVVGAIDPSPAVNGKGIDLLRSANVQVDLASGELAHRIKRQNEGMRKFVLTGVPFVTYKYAMTLDGRLATDSGDSRWVSSPESRAVVHRLRAWSDAVVVGAGTVMRDDPHLTAREAPCQRQPMRVVVGRELPLTPQSTLVRTVDEGPVLAVCGRSVSPEKRRQVESWGVETVAVEEDEQGGLDPEAVLSELGSRGVRYVLLEGGPRLAGAWWRTGHIDKVAAFVCAKITSGTSCYCPVVGPGVATMAEARVLQETSVELIGSDVLITGYMREPY